MWCRDRCVCQDRGVEIQILIKTTEIVKTHEGVMSLIKFVSKTCTLHRKSVSQSPNACKIDYNLTSEHGFVFTIQL
jgi:hypothetical protein